MNLAYGYLCRYCKHLEDTGKWVCEAFPKGIPHGLIEGLFDHRNPHPDDRGIQFELNTMKYDELPSNMDEYFAGVKASAEYGRKKAQEWLASLPKEKREYFRNASLTERLAMYIKAKEKGEIK